MEWYEVIFYGVFVTFLVNWTIVTYWKSKHNLFYDIFNFFTSPRALKVMKEKLEEAEWRSILEDVKDKLV